MKVMLASIDPNSMYEGLLELIMDLEDNDFSGDNGPDFTSAECIKAGIDNDQEYFAALANKENDVETAADKLLNLIRSSSSYYYGGETIVKDLDNGNCMVAITIETDN